MKHWSWSTVSFPLPPFFFKKGEIFIFLNQIPTSRYTVDVDHYVTQHIERYQLLDLILSYRAEKSKYLKIWSQGQFWDFTFFGFSILTLYIADSNLIPIQWLTCNSIKGAWSDFSNGNFYSNDSSSHKISRFQKSVKSVKLFWCKKSLRI